MSVLLYSCILDLRISVCYTAFFVLLKILSSLFKAKMLYCNFIVALLLSVACKKSETEKFNIVLLTKISTAAVN